MAKTPRKRFATIPFLKFEDAILAKKDVEKGELPKNFSYVEKEKTLYYLPNITANWVVVGEFMTKKEAVNFILKELEAEGFAKGGEIKGYYKYKWDGFEAYLRFKPSWKEWSWVVDSVQTGESLFSGYASNTELKDAKGAEDEMMFQISERIGITPKSQVGIYADGGMMADGGRVKKYELGDMWSPNFNYDGMLKMGINARITWGLEKLQALSDSFEDVNYHTENIKLIEAIDLLKKGDEAKARQALGTFNLRCRSALAQTDIDSMTLTQMQHDEAQLRREQGFAKGGGISDAAYKRRMKMFGHKPYGATKGKFKVTYNADGEPQTEIWDSMEMAKDSAKRYSRIDEFSDVKIFDESGKEIQFMARGGEPKPSLIPDYSKISGVVVEGIDTNDAPDFVDAYIVDAYYDGEPMTDEQLEELNYDGDFVYSAVLRHLYADGGKVKERVYIDYLNKAKGFKNDRKYFDSYEEAVTWARNNFDKFDSDYIKYEYADGGMAHGGQVTKVGEPYDSMTKYQVEKEYNRLNEKRDLLKRKYGTFESDEVVENEKEIDKIITLLYGRNFSGLGQKFKYADGGELTLYKILSKDKYDLQPKWEDEKLQTGGREFLTFKQAQDFKKKLQQMTDSIEYKVVKVEYADGGMTDGKKKRTIKLTLSDKDSYDYTYKQDGTTASITFGFGKEPFEYEVKNISKSLEPLQQDILDTFTLQGIKQYDYKGGYSEAIKHLDTAVLENMDEFADGGSTKGNWISSRNIGYGTKYKELTNGDKIRMNLGNGEYYHGTIKGQEILWEDGIKTNLTTSFGGSNANDKEVLRFAKGGYNYSPYEMVVISKELEKDGGRYIKDRFLVSAKDIFEARSKASDLWREQYGRSDLSIVKVISDEAYRQNYMGKYAKGGNVKKIGGKTAKRARLAETLIEFKK